MTFHQKYLSFALGNFAAAIALTSFVFSLTAPTFAQEAEIEIVNQDGEPVKGAKLMLKPKLKPKSDQVDLEDKVELEDNGTNKFMLKSENGKITVTDSEGNKQQIDLSGARSVVVQQSTQSVNNNGNQETKVVGKAIVVDADGQRHEIDLGQNGGEVIELPMMPKGFPGMFRANRNVNKFMIGVHCKPVPPALQVQLNLGEGTGLLVHAIGPDTPAAAAGLQKHDILLFADDQELLKQDDLVGVVQKAGKAKSSLSLTVMRGGEEIGVDVSPVERTAEQLRVGLLRGPMNFDFDFDLGGFGNDFDNVEFKQFGPGVIVGGNFDEAMEDMRQRMQQVQQQMQEMQERMKLQFEAGE